MQAETEIDCCYWHNNTIHANKKEIRKKKAHRVIDEKQRAKVRSVYLE